MSQQVLVSLVDDIDGSEAHGTVEFALDNKHYEIDLSEANAGNLRGVLAQYIDAARKGSSGGSRRGRAHVVTGGTARTPAVADKEQNQAIRSWAQANGLSVSDRGRIPVEIIDQYHANAGRPVKSVELPKDDGGSVTNISTKAKAPAKPKAKKSKYYPDGTPVFGSSAEFGAEVKSWARVERPDHEDTTKRGMATKALRAEWIEAHGEPTIEKAAKAN